MDILQKERKIRELEAKIDELDNELLINKLKEEIENYKHEAMTHLTAWDRVLVARHQHRPTACDFIEYIFDAFIELHGDRLFRDDQSIVGGLALLNGVSVTVVAEEPVV